MILSRYLHIFPYPADPGYMLLYSARNGAMALMPAEECLRLREGDIPEEYRQTLAELDMIVNDREAERREVFSLLEEINREDVGLNVAVILGLACNFSCLYCYEGSMKGGRAMEPATVKQTVAFLKERYSSRNKQRLTLDFYGGEPLLYPGIIKDIALPLKTYVEERGGMFRFSLVTNGSLLTREAVEDLLPSGLYAAKVTVDGPADEHDRLRPFASGRPSFETILANVGECCGLIKIGFGGNYTAGNYGRVAELLDCLPDYGLSPAIMPNVQFHPVIGTSDRYANPEFGGGCMSSNESWVAAASVAVRREVLLRGYDAPEITPSPCMVDLEDAFVINYDGSLFKCVAMIGHPQYAAGDIRQGFSDYRRIYSLGSWLDCQECRECSYLPLCFGGCRYMVFQRNGSMEGIDCRRLFYERILAATIQQDAMLRAGQEGEE